MMRFYKTTLTVVTLCIFGGITHAQTASAPALTKADAAAIALREQTGSIAEAELDRFEGRLVYDVEVVTENGEEVEFKIDAETGDILDKWTDDDPSDDPESSALETDAPLFSVFIVA